jgi:hypothetical protein
MKVILVLGFLLVGTDSAFAAATAENQSNTCCKTCMSPAALAGCLADAGNFKDKTVDEAPGDKVEKPGDSSEGK